MAAEKLYRISTSGSIIDGYEKKTVAKEFAAMFGVPPAKAAQFVQSQKLIKKGLTQEQAEVIQFKLSSIGVGVVIGGDAANSPSVKGKPSKARAKKGVARRPSAISKNAALSKVMELTKRALAPLMAMLGKGFSALYEKFKDTPVGEKVDQAVGPVADVLRILKDKASFAIEKSGLRGSPYLSPAVTAFVLAIVWLIAARYNTMELSFLAIAVGVGTGLAANATRKRGVLFATACAVFALAAIFCGKYMVASHVQSNFSDFYSAEDFQEEDDEFATQYSELQIAAAEFSKIPKTEKSIEKFMVKFNYTMANDPSGVTNYEFAEFSNFTRPYLESMGNKTSDIELLALAMVEEHGVKAKSMSTMEFILEYSGILDLIFLIIGVGAAFELTRRGSLR